MVFRELRMTDIPTVVDRLERKVETNTLKIQHYGCAQKPMASDGVRQRLRQKRSMDLLCCTREIWIIFANLQQWYQRRLCHMLLIDWICSVRLKIYWIKIIKSFSYIFDVKHSLIIFSLFLSNRFNSNKSNLKFTNFFHYSFFSQLVLVYLPM